jgi:hypothetical protein
MMKKFFAALVPGALLFLLLPLPAFSHAAGRPDAVPEAGRVSAGSEGALPYRGDFEVE